MPLNLLHALGSWATRDQGTDKTDEKQNMYMKALEST